MKKFFANTKGVSTTVTIILIVVAVIISVLTTAALMGAFTPKTTKPADDNTIKITTKTIPLFGEITHWDWATYYTSRVFYGGLRSHESGNASRKIITLIFESIGYYRAGVGQITLDYKEGMTIDLPYVTLRNVIATEMSISYDEVPRS